MQPDPSLRMGWVKYAWTCDTCRTRRVVAEQPKKLEVVK